MPATPTIGDIIGLPNLVAKSTGPAWPRPSHNLNMSHLIVTFHNETYVQNQTHQPPTKDIITDHTSYIPSRQLHNSNQWHHPNNV